MIFIGLLWLHFLTPFTCTYIVYIKLTLKCHAIVATGWLSTLQEKLAGSPRTTDLFCGVCVKTGGAEKDIGKWFTT